jgi:hypothetical protein
MASTRERVTFSGIVRGEGQEATCTIEATRVSLRGEPGVSHTTHWSMVDVSESLADGKYEVFADGQCNKVRLINGQWLGDGF